MNKVLARWNQLAPEAAAREILACCGSTAWARGLVNRRPIDDELILVRMSDAVWNGLTVNDWIEAFSKHPRIGERKVPRDAGAQSAAWSAQEQANVGTAEESASALAEENRAYEQRFGRVFIVCATGKTAGEMLGILRQRLKNDDDTELRISAEEQRKITNLRLKKWLNP